MNTVLPLLWLWRVRPVSSDLLGKLRRSEGNLPTRSATLFHAVPLRFLGREPVLGSGTKAWRCLEAGWEVAGSEERRRDDALGCHVRTSCHVKCCFVRGVERPLIGYQPRSQPRPRLLWHFWNPIVGYKTKPRQCHIASNQKEMSRFYLPLLYPIVFSWRNCEAGDVDFYRLCHGFHGFMDCKGCTIKSEPLQR